MVLDPLNLLRKGAWFTILNLSIADLIAGLSHFMKVGVYVGLKTPNIKTFLAVFRFLWMFGTGGSFLLLSWLTIQTYIIVRYPIRSRLMLSRKKIAISCAVIWAMAILMGFSNLSYLHTPFSFEQVMRILIAQVGVLELAAVVQVVLKFLIIKEILKSGRNAEVSTEHQNNHREIAKTIVILNVVLIITAFPYFAAKQIEYLYRLGVVGDNTVVRLLANYYEPVAVLNFALNPILYSLRLIDYRRSLVALLSCKFRQKSDVQRNTRTALSLLSSREENKESTKL